jgi:hypothetical protein
MLQHVVLCYVEALLCFLLSFSLFTVPASSYPLLEGSLCFHPALGITALATLEGSAQPVCMLACL